MSGLARNPDRGKRGSPSKSGNAPGAPCHAVLEKRGTSARSVGGSLIEQASKTYPGLREPAADDGLRRAPP
jgi:hypothetical protein